MLHYVHCTHNTLSAHAPRTCRPLKQTDDCVPQFEMFVGDGILCRYLLICQNISQANTAMDLVRISFPSSACHSYMEEIVISKKKKQLMSYVSYEKKPFDENRF